MAVPDGVGYGGVNHFYQLYLYRPARRSFQKSRVGQVGNPEPSPQTRTVSAPYKSGPAYAVSTLGLTSNGDLYQCRLGQIDVSSDVAENADDDSWQWFDERGRVVLALPLRRSGGDRSLWRVASVRAALRANPGALATTPYVVRGDKVEVLELRGDWAHVSFTGPRNRAVAGWMRRSELQRP